MRIPGAFPRPPLDDAERAAIANGKRRDPWRCSEVGPKRYECDVSLGDGDADAHEGDHIATCDDPDEVMDRWPNTTAPVGAGKEQ